MPTFKNFSPIDQDTCKILLYGAIGPYDEIRAADFVRELDYAAINYKKAKIRIHCPGGDVVEGLAIRNAIMQSPLDIEIYVDGMAASMGFVIAMCGKPLYMNKYARLMAHSVTGGGWGNADEMRRVADLIDSMETDLVDILMNRTGKTAEEIKALWFDGADHWITANEATEMKLVNGVFDGLELSYTEDIDRTELYNRISNILKSNSTDMKWENFFKRAGLRNDATEQEAIDVVEGLEKKNSDLKAENEQLKQKIADKEKVEKEKEEVEITELVENAVKDGRVKADLKEHYTNILKKDRKAGEAILNSISKPKRLLNELDGGQDQNEPEGSAKWTFSDWQKKDGKYLAQMKANDPERYKALYKAQFKKEPVM